MDDFLSRSGWHGATRIPLAADASFRRYERVLQDEKVAVLMDAPPPWENVAPFIAVTSHLQRYALSVPRILAQDVEAGFLLLEDLGDASFTKLLRAEPAREGELYKAATQALVKIVRASQGDDAVTLPLYDDAVYSREVALFAEWFLPQLVGIDRARALRDEWLALWGQLIHSSNIQQNCLVHRDYHADNLFWLNGQPGYCAVGMLDYQDALWGDSAYDIASLLEDARRDVSGRVVADCLRQFIEETGQDEDDFMVRYAVLAAQRNAKIIGIFTRLAVRDGKAHYLDYLPRVWDHFLNDFEHPILDPIAEFIDRHVPVDARGVIAVDTSMGGIVL
jgi:aminoglycoside/choline kinase family phosphotransferase